MEIPVALRTHFRKPRFVQSLESESRTVAERRVLPVVAGWKKEIAAARNEPVDDDAAYWRRALRNARDEEHRQSILEQIDYAAWDIGAINVENIGDAPPSPIGPTSSRQQPTSNGGQTNESARIGMTHRKLPQRKTLDIENEIRGTLKAFGLKLGKVSRGGSRRGSAHSSPIVPACAPQPSPCSWRAVLSWRNSTVCTAWFWRSCVGTRRAAA